jgi:peptidoglycan hydrolase CwlO-like protein
MSAVNFDTLKFARALRDNGGLPQIQAEGIADASREQLVTKSDLGSFSDQQTQHFAAVDKKADFNKSELEAKIDKLDSKVDSIKVELEHKIDSVKSDLEHKIDKLDQKIDRLDIKFEGKINLQNWMLRFMLAISLATLYLQFKK